jgi:hypothetical protein
MELLLWAGIALLQLLVLPGWLLVRSLALDRDGPLQTALYSWGFSLVLNHLLVMALVVTRAYTRPVLLALVAVECALGVWLWRRRPRPERHSFGRCVARRLTAEDAAGAIGWLLCAVAVSGFLLSLLPRSFGQVFEYWDVVVSWNRWAVDWEAGRLPAHVFHYPQLLPTSWSLVYVMLGYPLQFVARGAMALFPLSIALVLIDLWWQRGRRELLLAAVIAPLLMTAVLGSHMGSGLADIPVAAMALLAFHPLAARPFDADRRAGAARLAAAALLAVGCALTKQAGLYVALLLPVCAFVALRTWPARQRWIAVLGVVAILLVGLAPWYGYTELRVLRGMEINEARVLPALMFGDMPLLDRAARAYGLWEGVLTAPGAALALLLLAASLAHREARWITLCIGLPFTLIWAFYVSYDLRNDALAVPFLGISMAAGAEVLRRAWSERLPAGVRHRLALALAVATLAGIALWDPSPAILAASDRQLATLGKPALNQALLAYQAEHGFDGKILTNYRYLTSFPALRDHYFVNRDATGADFWTFRTDLEGFRRVVEDPELDVNYIFIEGRLDDDVELYLDARTRAGSYEIAFEGHGARLYHIVKRR